MNASSPGAPGNHPASSPPGHISGVPGSTGIATNTVFLKAMPPEMTLHGTKLFAIARIGQARQSLADMLVCYGRLLQSNEDENSRVQLRAEMAGLLLDKDPELLDCFLEAAGKRRKASGPRVLELFDGMCSIARHYEEAGVAGDAPAWNDLQRMTENLMASYRDRVEELLPALKLEGVALKLVPTWLTDAAKSLAGDTAAARLPGMLAQSAASLLEGEGFKQALDSLDELSVAGMNVEGLSLARHLCSALNTSSKEERIKAVAGLAMLIENSMDQTSPPVLFFEDELNAACARETSEAVLRTFLNYMLDRMVALFNRSYFERSVAHAQTVATLDKSYRKAMGEDGTNPVREGCAELSKTAWAQNLVEGLLSGGEKERAAAQILSAIDRNLAATLITCISREEAMPRVLAYARYLRELCPGSARALFAMLEAQSDPVRMMRMLAIAPHVGGEDELLEMIYPMLTHNNAELREMALQYVLERDTERTAGFISNRVRDPRCATQRDTWIGVLSKLRHPAAAQVIMGELQFEIDAPMQDDRRLMALIEACNAHEDARIGTVLLRLLRPITGLQETRRMTPVQRENGKSLKMAGMKALGRYLRDPRVYEALDRLRKDHDQDIARMAAYCMNTPQDLNQRQASMPISATGSYAAAHTSAMRPSTRTTQTPENAPKTRKGFEELEQRANADAIFQPGATISGSGRQQRLPQEKMETPIPMAPPNAKGVVFSGAHAALDPAALPEDLFAGMKALLEGDISDLGLGMTARITCAKNGVMVIRSALGNGAIYIQNKIVVASFFAGMSDIQALAAIGQLKQAQFAYYAKSFNYAATMSVEVSNIETAVREYLDMR